MKATWIAPFVLALAATPALADDTDTDNGQLQDGAQQGQMQQGTTSHDSMDTGMGNADADNGGQMTRQTGDTDTDNDDMDLRYRYRHGYRFLIDVA